MRHCSTDASNVLLRTLEQRGTDIVEMVVTRGDQASRAAASRAATASPRSFGGTNERLKTDVVEIVDRLAKSNEVLSSLLAGAEGNLLKIESTLSSRATEFGKSIEHAVESTAALLGRTRRPGRAGSPRCRARSSRASAAS